MGGTYVPQSSWRETAGGRPGIEETGSCCHNKVGQLEIGFAREDYATTMDLRLSPYPRRLPIPRPWVSSTIPILPTRLSVTGARSAPSLEGKGSPPPKPGREEKLNGAVKMERAKVFIVNQDASALIRVNEARTDLEPR
jgi:hypothetical protein